MELANGAVDDRRNEEKREGTKQTSAVHQATNSEVVCSRRGPRFVHRRGARVECVAERGKMNSTKGESNCQRSRT